MSIDLAEVRRLAEAVVKTDSPAAWHAWVPYNNVGVIITLLDLLEAAEARAKRYREAVVWLNTEKTFGEPFPPDIQQAIYWAEEEVP